MERRYPYCILCIASELYGREGDTHSELEADPKGVLINKLFFFSHVEPLLQREKVRQKGKRLIRKCTSCAKNHCSGRTFSDSVGVDRESREGHGCSCVVCAALC